MPIETNAPLATPLSPAPIAGERRVFPALLAGACGRCPACARGKMFRAFLKVADTCPKCGEALHHQRADDAPAYFTMAIVAHVVVGGILALERAMAPETWVHLAIWLPLTTVLTFGLLPRIKGALVALQWALRMHGFGGEPDGAMPDPAADVVAREQRP